MSMIVGALQMQSRDDLRANLETAGALLAAASAQGARLVVLPENFAVFGPGLQLATAARLPYIQDWLAGQAQKHGLWIVAGSIPCASRPDGTPVEGGRVRASCLVYDSQGGLAGRYDKMHLFDVTVDDAQARYQESATFEPGDDVVVIETPFARIGLSICYDLRFPVLYQALRDRGADIIAVPAAFTAVTGAAHWEVLLRARAIETQCFIIGAGQGGEHGPTRRTWGHSQIIDPWGRVLGVRSEEGSGLVIACCDLAEQARIRQQMPLLSHRRLC